MSGETQAFLVVMAPWVLVGVLGIALNAMQKKYRLAKRQVDTQFKNMQDDYNDRIGEHGQIIDQREWMCHYDQNGRCFMMIRRDFDLNGDSVRVEQ